MQSLCSFFHPIYEPIKFKLAQYHYFSICLTLTVRGTYLQFHCYRVSPRHLLEFGQQYLMLFFYFQNNSVDSRTKSYEHHLNYCPNSFSELKTVLEWRSLEQYQISPCVYIRRFRINFYYMALTIIALILYLELEIEH